MPPLCSDPEIALGGSGPSPRTTHQLIEANRPFARAIASECLRTSPPSIDHAEVFSAADCGLVQAAESYDPTRGVSFPTFAYYRIRGAVYDVLRRASRHYKFEVAANEYLADCSATLSRGGAELESSEIRNITRGLMTCYVLAHDPAIGRADFAAVDPEQHLLDQEQRQILMRSIAGLPERNRQLIQHYYFEEKSLEEIGKIMGLSKSWVSRMHARSIDWIRESCKAALSKTALPVPARPFHPIAASTPPAPAPEAPSSPVKGRQLFPGHRDKS